MSAHKKFLHKLREQEGADWQALVDGFLKEKKLSAEDKKALGLEVYHEILKLAVANLHIDGQEAQNLAAVKAYFRLSEKAIQELKRRYAPKALKMLLEWFLVDGILTPSERAQLISFGKELALSEEEIEKLAQEMMEKQK